MRVIGQMLPTAEDAKLLATLSVDELERLEALFESFQKRNFPRGVPKIRPGVVVKVVRVDFAAVIAQLRADSTSPHPTRSSEVGARAYGISLARPELSTDECQALAEAELAGMPDVEAEAAPAPTNKKRPRGRKVEDGDKSSLVERLGRVRRYQSQETRTEP